MNAHTANLINAILLIAMAGWGYLSSETPSPTALIPVGVGVALLACYPGVKKENKVISHIAVLLTFIVLLGFYKPLTGALGRADNMAVMRVGIMIASSILAMVYFIKSFRDARKKREAEAKANANA